MLTIQLTKEQLQRALIVLGKAPYADIADVIDAIKYQASEQLSSEEVQNGVTNDSQ